MSTFLKSDSDVTDPLSTMPYLEKDAAITRGVTLGLFDLSNPDCYAGAGNIMGTTSFLNLVKDGAAAALGGLTTQGYRAVERGMIPLKTPVSGSPPFNFPANASLDATVTRALISFFMAFDNTGLTASSTTALAGMGTGTGTALKWVVYLVANADGGAATLQFRVRGASANIDCNLTTDLATIFNGTTRQFAFSVEIKSGIAYLSIYIDGEVKATASGAMTAFNQVGTQPVFIGGPGAGSIGSRNVNAWMGRFMINNLSARSDLTFDQLLEKDRNAAAGYIT
ncbi:hypothetical protein [uncultured Acinetobacter sp.]|uniref:hypothetical protein n=1 Tax=uncultured Acinetobacter sp. TaxID=165433 RepID=UPI00258E1EDC|nr:hypothetical protein [uncultured Acinetobacter sp.]